MIKKLSKFIFFLSLFGFSNNNYALSQITNSTFGKVRIELNIDDAFIIFDNDFTKSYKYRHQQIFELPEGDRKITIVHPQMNDFTSKIKIIPDSLVIFKLKTYSFRENPQSSYYVLSQNKNFEFKTESQGKIFIDNKFYGIGKLSTIINPGKHILRVEHPVYGFLTKKIIINTKEILSLQRYNHNKDEFPLALKILPGGAYLNNKQFYKFGITTIGMSSLAMLLSKNYAQIRDHKSDFNQIEVLYLNTNSKTEIIRYRNELKDIQTNIKNKKNTINTAWIVTFLLYGITTVDGLRKPKEGYKIKKTNFNIDPIALALQQGIQIKLTKKF